MTVLDGLLQLRETLSDPDVLEYLDFEIDRLLLAEIISKSIKIQKHIIETEIKILELLNNSECPLTRTEIANEIGETNQRTQVALMRLKENNFLKNEG